jgi:hypothetical protein
MSHVKAICPAYITENSSALDATPSGIPNAEYSHFDDDASELLSQSESLTAELRAFSEQLSDLLPVSLFLSSHVGRQPTVSVYEISHSFVYRSSDS